MTDPTPEIPAEVRDELLAQREREEEVMVIRVHREALDEMGLLAQRLWEVERTVVTQSPLAAQWLREAAGYLRELRRNAVPEGGER